MSNDDIDNDNDSIPEEGHRLASPKQPSEFATFIRDTFIRALDHYATRVVEPREGDEKRPAKPIRKIADHWLTLEETQKVRFFDQVVGAAEVAIAAAPVAIATLREKRRRKATEEDAATEQAAAPDAAARKKKAAVKKTAKKKSSSSTTGAGATKKKAKTKEGKKKQ